MLEEIEVCYEYGSQDLQTDCIRLGRSEDGDITLYFWGRGDAGAAALNWESAELLRDQLNELIEMSEVVRL